MSLRIASWNVEGRLNNYAKKGRGTPEHIMAGIKKLDADVVVLPEAYINTIDEQSEKQIRALGYEIIDTPYGDYGRENQKYMVGTLHMCVLSRLPMEDIEYKRWGDVRNLITCTVNDSQTGRKVRIIAIHLDDRSESARQKQVEEIIPYIQKSSLPIVMLGDFNAMWPKGRAKLLNTTFVRRAARLLPNEDLRSIAIRLTDMATGSVLTDIATKTGLRDADPRQRSTTTPKIRGVLFMPSIRLVQIDHILVSSEISVSNFEIGRDGGSDHRSISATLALK